MAEISTAYINQITERLNQISEYLDSATAGMENASEEQIQKTLNSLSEFLEKELLDVRQQIIDFASGQYCAALKQLEILDPIVNVSLSDLPSLLEWAGNVIEWLTGGYSKLIAFQAEIVIAVANLSLAVINIATHSFPSLPNAPSISISIPPIEISDITTCPT